MTPPSLRHNDRVGMVPIEIVMALPLLLIMFGFVFVTVSSGLSRTTVANEARHQALRARHTPWRADPLAKYEIESLPVEGMDLPAKMLNPGAISYHGEPATSGAPQHEAEAMVNPIMNFYQPFIGKVSFDATVVGGVWDYRETPFREHPRLTLTDRAINFAVPDIGGLASLGGFGGGFSGHSGNVSAQLAQELSANQFNSQQIDVARNLKQQLTSQLNSLLSARKPKRGLIDQVRRQITAVSQGIDNMERAQRLIAGSQTP